MTTTIPFDQLPSHKPPSIGKGGSIPVPCSCQIHWREAESKLSFKGTNIFTVPLNIKMQSPDGYWYPMLLWYTHQEDASYALVHFDSNYLLERFLKEWVGILGWEPTPETFSDFANSLTNYLTEHEKLERESKIRIHARELSELMPHISEDDWFKKLLKEAEADLKKKTPAAKTETSTTK